MKFFKRAMTAQDVFYSIGAVIVLLGVSLFVQQIWDELTKPLRAILTLGASACLYAVAFTIKRNTNAEFFSRVIFIIFIFLLPLGIGTFLDLIGFSYRDPIGITVISLICFIPYFISWYYLKEKVFFIFSVIMGSSAAYALSDMILDFEAHRFFAIGLSYIAFAWWSGSRDQPVPFLNALGFITSLTAGMFLLSDDHLAWIFLFPVLLLGVFYLAIKIQSRATFVIGGIFTVAYILYMAFEYFDNGLIWPFAIILVGFAVMSLGYFGWFSQKFFQGRVPKTPAKKK